MSKKASVLILTCVLLGSSFVVLLFSKEQPAAPLTFSNTQKWRSDYLEAANSQPTFQCELCVLPAPPINNSGQTKAELQYLHLLSQTRTPKVIADIQFEAGSEGIVIHGKKFEEELISYKTRPATSALFYTLLPSLKHHVMHQKERFDRVRPSYLDQTLTTTITVPDHPSYPSGHATQLMFIGLFLGELDPANQHIYLQDAYRISHNREIAGVHYPSDTTAGFMLANQFFASVMSDPEIVNALEEAKSEW